MNLAVKKIWIEKLRSKEYQQGRNSLKHNGKFCCLGVLCDISNIGYWGDKNAYSENYVCPNSSQGYTLPDDVRIWAGLTVKEEDMLAIKNDNGKTFEEIANCIEEWI